MTVKKISRSEMKRQAILEAAKQAFQADGVQGTSMDKLAAMAQVSKRTVYNHFASKEALVVHLMSELWQRSMQAIDVSYDPRLSLDEQLLALVKAEIEVICCPQSLELTRVAFGHYFYHPDALSKEMEKFAKQEMALTKWLRAAMDDGRLKPLDVDFANTQLHNLLKGNCFWPQLMKMAPPLDEAQREHLARETVGMFLSYYRA